MITILRGCPGCGKTTYIKELIKQNKEFVVVSSDGVRQMLWGIDSKFEKADFDLVYEIMRKAIEVAKQKNDVIIETANLHPVDKLLSIYHLQKDEGIKVVDVNYKITFDQCLKNVRGREYDNDISEERLREMYNQWQKLLKETE